MATKPFEIVILGGNFGGLGVAHFLLRHSIPSLQALDKNARFHITLVSPNSKAYFKVGSPRTLVQPQLLPEAKLWKPLSEAFAQYSSEQITVIQALAIKILPDERTVTIMFKSPSPDQVDERSIPYDALFIATGTSAENPIWTLHEDETMTSRIFAQLHKALPSAKTILIGGGGPVGVETAGEIASVHRDAEITLLSGGERLLPRVKSAVGARAEEQLKQLGVKVVHGVEVIHGGRAPGSESASQVSLSDDTSRTVDVYIDATGGAANSHFVPEEWLGELGPGRDQAAHRVKTRDAYFRVADGVYAVGDIVSGSGSTLFELDAMVPTACSAFVVDVAKKLNTEPATSGGLLGMFFRGGASVPVEKEFKPLRNTIIVPIGPDGGVGLVMGWQVPSWFVRVAKSKTFLIDMFDTVVSGSKWKA
ncbi:hypothetical protein F4777DRAFT_539018 [Nemania sp. FL0916]|nr:hypothetical protein F4777DRAFT_539018 [Nemania sp. FL0916]